VKYGEERRGVANYQKEKSKISGTAKNNEAKNFSAPSSNRSQRERQSVRRSSGQGSHLRDANTASFGFDWEVGRPCKVLIRNQGGGIKRVQKRGKRRAFNPGESCQTKSEPTEPKRKRRP